mgnify:CR=1 FL=1
MKALKALGYCLAAFVVFNASMFTTALIIDKGLENEQVTSSITQQSETNTTIEETQTTTTESSYSNESTQEEVTYQTPTFTPANTDEYTVNEYMGYDPNLNGDSYSITRNSDGMSGVLTIDEQANMQWYYFDAEGIHTN